VNLEIRTMLREYATEYAAWEATIEAINENRRAARRGTRGLISQIYDLQQEAHEHCEKGMVALRQLRGWGLSDAQIAEELELLDL
jgi:hypothetical protein